jgi:hypothetical protein
MAPALGAIPVPSMPDAAARVDAIATRYRVPHAVTDFIHDREPPREWVRRLEQLSPPTDAHSFLRIVWEAGDPWIPAQRWTVQQMVHPSVVDPDFLKELRGPNPRSEGHMCTSMPTHEWPVRPPPGYRPCFCRRKTEAWRGGPCSAITLSQWKTFQRTGYVPRPFWVIEGDKGGHRESFSPQEQMVLEFCGYPIETPRIGSREYAPFDERVLSQIPRFNRLWKLGVTLERFQRMMSRDGIRSFKQAEEQEARKQLLHEIEDEMREVSDLFVSAADKGEMDHLPRTEIDYERLSDMNDQHYVETGNVLSHTKV